MCGELQYDDVFADFREYLQVRNYANRTIEHNFGSLKKYLQYFDKNNLSIYSAEMEHIEAFIAGKREIYAPGTIESILTGIKRFYRYLFRKKLIATNPASSLTFKKSYVLPRNILTSAEAEKMLRQPDVKTDVGIRDRAILETLYSSGLRLMELCNLTLSDANTHAGEIIVRQGKGSKDRVIPLGNQGRLLQIKEYHDQERERREGSGGAVGQGCREIYKTLFEAQERTALWQNYRCFVFITARKKI